jgi:Tol biopolymer transport system component
LGEASIDLGDFNDVAVSPDGTRIAFVRIVTYTVNEESVTAPELFVAPLDAPNEATQITQLRSNTLRQPTWSPDSTELAFASDADNDFEIYRVSAAGGAPRQLTVNESVDTDPDWSPDGTLIAYASDQDSPGFLEVYTMDLFGNDITRITDASGNNFSPRWSPDGTQFAFVSDRTGRGEIFLMLNNGNGQVMLTVGDGDAENRSPLWSPDGRWIAFRSNRPTEDSTDKFNWFVMDTRGQNVSPVVVNDREPQSLAFLPAR